MDKIINGNKRIFGKMKKIRFVLLFAGVFTALMFLPSCIEKPVYPSEPVIAYDSFIRYGNDPANPDSVEVVISFTDNEGNVGLGQADTHGFFKDGNLYMVYYYDSANTWAAFDTSIGTGGFDTFKVAYRVPPLLPDGDPSEPMKGLIYVKQSPFFHVHNKIRYGIYLYDLTNYKSNTVYTPAITF